MSLLGALTDKPWLTPGLSDAARMHPEETAEPWDSGIMLGLFLVVVTMIFGLAATAYMMRMGHGEASGPLGADWRYFREPPLLWINTAILVASSAAFVAAERGARRGDAGAARLGVATGGLLGLAFLVGQVLLWRKLSDWGYVLRFSGGLCRTGDPLFTFPFPQTILGNPALAFFYLISGLHGVHIVGGLVAWAVTAQRVFANGATAAGARAVQLCGRYWHFLLLVWAAMMGLFATT